VPTEAESLGRSWRSPAQWIGQRQAFDLALAQAMIPRTGSSEEGPARTQEEISRDRSRQVDRSASDRQCGAELRLRRRVGVIRQVAAQPVDERFLSGLPTAAWLGE